MKTWTKVAILELTAPSHPRESPYEDSRLSRRPYYAERSRYRS